MTPFDPWRVELTNPVDARRLRKDLVRVEPDLPGLKVEAWGDTLAIRGAARGRATYRVTLSSAIADVFGQSLEPGGPLAFTVGPAPAALFAPGGDFVVLDPGGWTRFPVHSVNHASLRVEAGVAWYGADIDDSVIMPETRLEHMVHYAKGCYIGQEVINRIHSIGHVNRELVGLWLADDLKTCAREGRQTFPRGQ